jgi:hypothetical protein
MSRYEPEEIASIVIVFAALLFALAAFALGGWAIVNRIREAREDGQAQIRRLDRNGRVEHLRDGWRCL